VHDVAIQMRGCFHNVPLDAMLLPADQGSFIVTRLTETAGMRLLKALIYSSVAVTGDSEFITNEEIENNGRNNHLMDDSATRG
jgi:hypothetical protein